MKLLDVEIFVALLCCSLAHLTLSQPPPNASQQTNSSLPALSERSTNGLNSRYLSAGSTASLAAATVAAANQAPQQQQQQQHQQSSVPHQASHSHQNQHAQPQQPQQQQQQQQQPSAPQSDIHNAQQGQPAVLGGLQSPTQYSTNTALQAAPQALASPQGLFGPVAPVMSSTYAFNPLTGQYGPADAGQQSFLPPASSTGYQFQLQQQQQPFLQQQQQAFFGQPASNNLAVSRFAQRFGSANHPPYYQPSSGYLGQQQQQLPYSRYPQPAGYTRRNGQLAPGTGARNTNYLLASGAGNQLIDDDSNGLYQQQQVSGASLADQLAASLGLNLDPSYVTSNQKGVASSNNQGFAQSHLQASGGGAEQQQLGYGQPTSSVASPFLSPAGPQSGGGSALVASDYTKSDQCIAADGRHGTCYQASECLRRGGTPMGRCGAGQNLAGELSGASHVCCLFDVTCGQFAAERFVYFRNPNYPSTYDQSRMCRAKIGKLDKGTCQFRLDLSRFDIAKPTNGNCSQDMFVVSGQNENYVIPKICGLNDGQHYYVGVDESGVITLHMMMMGYYRRSFEILVTQIPCRSDFAAPAHCLQYFMGTHGTIKSFNYDDEFGYTNSAAGQSQLSGAFVNYDLQQDGSSQAGGSAVSAPYGLQFAASNSNQQLQQRQQPIYSAAQSNRYNGGAGEFGGSFVSQYGGYPNDLDYTICIRKESGFCSITYQLSRSDQGLAPFAVGNSLYGHNETSGYGGAGPATTSGWNSVSTECRDDYLLIGGVRLCSGSGSGANVAAQSPFYEQTVHFNQFNQNNSQNVYANQLQQQQLQQQQNSLMQQLARLQQQQAVLAVGGNATQNLQSSQQQQQASNAVSGSANLEQQQAAIVQQLMLIQQQMNSLAAGGQLQQQQQQQQQQFNSRPFQDGSPYSPAGSQADSQGAIITDTTSGPFLLRFVSNVARNARGFHIDYRQNPCK